MDKEQLRIRAERRRKLVADVQDSLVAEIGMYWLQKAVARWPNPTEQPKVPEGVPVGPDFERFVKDYMKANGFRTLEFGDGAVKAGAEAVANWVDFNGMRMVGVDYPNPMSEIDKAKEEGYTVASTKTAAHIYGPVKEDRHRTMYGPPEEWTRYSPDNPGVQMVRIRDGLYQDPITGQTYEYEGNKVSNQTNPNWNKTWVQKGFLDTPNQQSTRASGGTYDEDSEKELPVYDEKSKDVTLKPHTPDLYANEGAMEGTPSKDKKEYSYSGIQQTAERIQVIDEVFGETTRNTRYCPDHHGVSLYRLADGVYQCPLDRSVYDYNEGFTTQDGKEHNGGSVAEMTPDWAGFYQSPHPFLVSGSVKKFTKLAARTSVLERFVPRMQAWKMEDVPLEQAQREISEFLESTRIPHKIRQQMLGKIEAQQSLDDLIHYLWQSLLMGSGLGTIKSKGVRGLTKEAFNVEIRLARDIERALAGDEEARKILGLVTDGVFNKGKSFMEAAQAAYEHIEYMKQGQETQPTFEVTDEEPGPRTYATTPDPAADYAAWEGIQRGLEQRK